MALNNFKCDRLMPLDFEGLRLVYCETLQCLSKRFYQWKRRISSLSEQRNSIPPLRCNVNQSLNLKALCSLETTDVRVVL